MANTTKITGNFLQIKGLDADWSLPGDLDKYFDESGIRVKSITFNPSGADTMIIKECDPGYVTTAALIAAQAATAPRIFDVSCDDADDQRVKYFGEKGRVMRPFIDISDCTFIAAANAYVEFELA